MMTFVQLSAYQRGLYLLLYFLLFLLDCYQLAVLIQQRTSKKMLTVSLVLAIAEFLFCELLMNQNRGYMTDLSISHALVVGCASVFSLVLLIQEVILHHQRHSAITPLTIKEAIDRLPVGIYYYYPNGICKLVNLQMDDLVRNITGDRLKDGKEFWKALTHGYIAHGTLLQSGNNPILVLDNHAAYSFSRKKLLIQGVPIYEVIASDVTKEYLLNTELMEAQKKAKEINTRLSFINETITEVTIEKEILNSKIRMHDEWGRCLLMIRKLLKSPAKEDKAEVLRALEKNIALLESEGELAPEENYDEIMESASSLGIEVLVTGRLPSSHSEIINTAITVCLSNTIQHAHGSKLFIVVKPLEHEDEIIITNNGDDPAHPVQEKGGLSNLRKIVERDGGIMTVESSPHFKLILQLERNDNGL